MSHLVLELRPGEMMVVNGATIRFRSKCRVELVSQARFVFGKQVMAQDEAETSLRKLYYNLQMIYAGAPEEQAEARQRLMTLMGHLRRDDQVEVTAAIGAIEHCLETGDFYRTLKLLRAMIRNEVSQAAASDGDL